jgi:hypothetical protein
MLEDILLGESKQRAPKTMLARGQNSQRGKEKMMKRIANDLRRYALKKHNADQKE